MKKFVYIFAGLFIYAACSGTIDEGDNTQNMPDEFTEPFTLSADKAVAEASGEDYVVFSLKDSYGREMLSDENALSNVNIICDEGPRVPRLDNRARFIANGKYHYTATYKGKSSNTVEIEAKNRRQYETFHKNVALYKATATWCGPCANMTKVLEGLSDEAKGHVVELCWHYGLPYNGIYDPYAVSMDGNDCGNLVVGYFRGTGVPTVGLDLVKKVTETDPAVIANDIWDIRAEYPATCGIKLSTTYDASTGVIEAEAELSSSTGGEYDMCFAVLLNDQEYASGTNEGGRYSHIVRTATGNFLMYSGNIRTVEKGTSTIFRKTLNYRSENLSVVALALVRDGDGARIDNVVEVRAGESMRDYIYNE